MSSTSTILDRKDNVNTAQTVIGKQTEKNKASNKTNKKTPFFNDDFLTRHVNALPAGRQVTSHAFSWLRVVNDIGTAIREHKGYIHIPKLTVADCI